MRHYACYLLGILYLINIVNSYAGDEIYEYENSSGQVVVSNIGAAAAKKLLLPPLSVYAQPMTKSDVNAIGYTTKPDLTHKASSMASSGGLYFTQKQNATRTKILTEELSKEEQALSNSQKLLIAGQNIRYQNENSSIYQERINALQDSVIEHKKNIAILTQELR